MNQTIKKNTSLTYVEWYPAQMMHSDIGQEKIS